MQPNGYITYNPIFKSRSQPLTFEAALQATRLAGAALKHPCCCTTLPRAVPCALACCIAHDNQRWKRPNYAIVLALAGPDYQFDCNCGGDRERCTDSSQVHWPCGHGPPRTEQICCTKTLSGKNARSSGRRVGECNSHTQNSLTTAAP